MNSTYHLKILKVWLKSVPHNLWRFPCYLLLFIEHNHSTTTCYSLDGRTDKHWDIFGHKRKHTLPLVFGYLYATPNRTEKVKEIAVNILPASTDELCAAEPRTIQRKRLSNFKHLVKCKKWSYDLGKLTSNKDAKFLGTPKKKKKQHSLICNTNRL